MSRPGDDVNEEDGTCCPICQDAYRDPRVVPCSHTFCRRCLTGHILASERLHHRANSSPHSFVCPLCNCVVVAPDPQQHRFFWARQFPTNDKLQQQVATKLTAIGGGVGGEKAESEVGGGGASCQSHPSAKAETWCTDHDVAVCWECIISTHKPCSGILKLPQAAARRKQEVHDMRTRLDALRDSFEKELERLDNQESRMAAERRTTRSDVEDFHERMTALLADKREELLARVEESHASCAEEAERKRGAWRGMVEEIDETSMVAEMLYMQATELEVLAQFSPLKQQFDNLQYMLPALGTPLQLYRWALKDPDICIQDLRCLTVEEIPSEAVTAADSDAAVLGPRHTSSSSAARGSPETSSSSSSSVSSHQSALSGATRDRRSHTLHKIRRRRQRVTPSNFARADDTATTSGGQDQKGRKGGEVKAVQVSEFSAAIDSDADSYGLGDVCLLHPREVLLVAYLNSPALRVFFPTPLPGLPLPAVTAPSAEQGSGAKKAPTEGNRAGGGGGGGGGSSGRHATILNISSKSDSAVAVSVDKHGATKSPVRDGHSNSAGFTGLNPKPSVCELTHSPCCLAQLSSDLVVATSSTTSQLSIVRVSASSARAWRRVEVGKQYRAVARAGGPLTSSSSASTSSCVALATYHSGEAAENVIDFVQFDAEFKTFTLLRTVSSRCGGGSGGGWGIGYTSSSLGHASATVPGPAFAGACHASVGGSSLGHVPSSAGIGHHALSALGTTPKHALATNGTSHASDVGGGGGLDHASLSPGCHQASSSALGSTPSHAFATNAPPLFRAPHSLWVGKEGELVVSDGDTPAVVGISRQGEPSFRFKPDDEEILDSPAGVVGTATGEIYVADACTQCVLRLSPSGRHLGDVLGPDSRLQSPVALALTASGMLYVADFYGGVRVFSTGV